MLLKEGACSEHKFTRRVPNRNELDCCNLSLGAILCQIDLGLSTVPCFSIRWGSFLALTGLRLTTAAVLQHMVAKKSFLDKKTFWTLYTFVKRKNMYEMKSSKRAQKAFYKRQFLELINCSSSRIQLCRTNTPTCGFCRLQGQNMW